MPSLHDFEMSSITGEPVALRDYEGQVCLVVNLASKCGLTPQYAGLRTLHESHADRGFRVLGFPCNQFGAQEPGTHEEILAFAREKYGAEFPIFAKVDVNGSGTCDLYKFLKSGHPTPDGKEDITWNFTKFLVGRDGQVLARFEPQVTPEEIGEALAAHL